MEPRKPLLRRLRSAVRAIFKDENFLDILGGIEGTVSKVLSIAMLFVILAAVYDLATFLFEQLFLKEPLGHFGSSATLFRVFGLFLNVLIALEILENITAYLKKHVIQVELVIVTSLIAVARKIIILDLEKTAGLDLIALAAAILALSISYWVIKRVSPKADHH